MTKRAFLFRGLIGSVYSKGLDDIAEALNASGVVTSVYSQSNADGALRDLVAVYQPNDEIFTGGHSNGAGECIEFARMMKASHGFTIRCAILLDLSTRETLPSNIAKCISWRQPQRAFAGSWYHPETPFHGQLETLDLPEIEGGHVGLDDHKEVKELFMSRFAGDAARVETPFYVGTGTQITEAELVAEAARHNIPAYLALAATYIESKDLEGSWSSGALVALFEDHVAYRNTSGEVRQRLVNERLAARGWRDLSYPKSPYPAIDRVVEIAGAEVAALSTSWGMYQILGENYRLLGFSTAVEMVDYFKQSEANQFSAWVRLIDEFGVKDDLLREDWAGYARRYNGPKFAAHNYHGKLAGLAAKFKSKYGSGIVGAPLETPRPVPVPTPPEIPNVPEPRTWPNEADDVLNALRRIGVKSGHPFTIEFDAGGNAEFLLPRMSADDLTSLYKQNPLHPVSAAGAGQKQVINMNGNKKAALGSMGVLGGGVGLGGILTVLYSISTGNPPAEVGQAVEQGQQAIDGFNQIMTGVGVAAAAIGNIFAIIGRIRATSEIGGVFTAGK